MVAETWSLSDMRIIHSARYSRVRHIYKVTCADEGSLLSKTKDLYEWVPPHGDNVIAFRLDELPAEALW